MELIKAFIERANDGTYSVYVDLENNHLNYGIHGTGVSANQAVDDFMSAYEAMKELHSEKGKEFVEAKFDFQYDMASFLQYYSNKFTFAGLQNITGVSQAQLSQYASGYRKPGVKTVKRIEASLHSFAKEISQVHFTV